MPTRLSNLKAVEVSIVPRGANKQNFLVVKEDVGMPDIFKVLKDAGFDGTLSDKVLKNLEPMMKELSDKGKNAVQAALKILAAVQDEVPAETMKALMALAGVGNEPAPPPPAVPAVTDKADPGAGDVHTDKPDEMLPVKKEDGSWDFSKIPENVRSVIQTIWKEKDESATKLAKVQKELDDARDARVTKEFQEKAGTFKALGVKTEDLASVMKEVSEKAPNAFKALEPMLKSFEEKIAKGGLFTETGSSGAGAAVAKAGQTEAEAKIDAIAKGIVEKSADGKKLSHTQAVAKAWQDNPALYNAHEAEIASRRK